ncbi:Nucleoporin nup84, partial [Coemansia sp. RSA 2052]
MSTLDIMARFAAVVDAQSGREDIGSAASQARVYRQLAKQQLEALEGDRFSGRGQQQQSAETYWQTEGSTWDLVERLYGLRAQAQTQDGEGGEDIEVTATATDFGAVQALLGRDSQLAECVEVRRWLEEAAPAFQAVETRKGYLFYTRRSTAARGADTVTEADPDATSRQRRGLAPEDAEYAAGLVRTLYEYVRRGRAGSAIALCVESDDAWRAATLKGSLFWRDPALERGEANNVHAGGNINRALWKHACAALAADDANDAYERALYAALSGRLDEVALVCDGWDDHLWAHVNALVEARIDRAVADAAPLYVPAQTAALAPVPSRHAPPRDLAHILDALASHDAPPLRHAAAQPFRRLQAAVIIDGFPAYLAAYALQIGPDADLLRVVVHIALHLRGLGFALPPDAVAAVLDAYIDLLIRENRDLVAVYVACLPPGRQTEAYAQFLRTVEDPAPARMQLLALAAAHGLDVDQVAKRAAQL